MLLSKADATSHSLFLQFQLRPSFLFLLLSGALLLYCTGFGISQTLQLSILQKVISAVSLGLIYWLELAHCKDREAEQEGTQSWRKEVRKQMDPPLESLANWWSSSSALFEEDDEPPLNPWQQLTVKSNSAPCDFSRLV